MTKAEFEKSMERITTHYPWITQDKGQYLSSIYEHVKGIELEYFEAVCVSVAARLSQKRPPLPGDFLFQARDMREQTRTPARGLTKEERKAWNLEEAKSMGPKGAAVSLALAKKYGVVFDPEILAILEPKAAQHTAPIQGDQVEFFS